MFLSAAYAKKRPKLRKKNDAEKKTLKDAISHYNKIVGYCSSTSDHTSVTESDVLAKNVLWKAMKAIRISLLTAVREIRLFWIFFWLGIAQDKMETVEAFNKIQ